MKIFTRTILLFVALNVAQNNMYAAVYGSDTTVSIVNPFNIPTAADNIIRTFGCVKNGFAFQDLRTSCTFQSIFPVAGPISLKGGNLYLMSDLILSNTGSILDLGTIYGANHVLELSQYNKSFSSGTQPNGKLVLNTAASRTLTRLSRSFDWSYDGKYLAVGITSGGGSDLYIYEFTGTSLVSRASLNISTGVNSIRWRPGSYYLAIASTSSPYLRSYQFTPPSTLTARGTVTGTTALRTVAWQSRGTHLAFGGTTTTGITIYSYNTGTGAFSLVATSTNSAALGGTVQYDAIKWAPTGNKDDIIAGTYTSATVGTLHLYNFTGAALNHLKAYSQAKGIYALDWCATSTYIAAGCSDGTLRTYQHSAAGNAIAQKYSETLTGAVNSVNWKYNATELAVARASAAAREFQVYSFDTSTYALNEKYPIALTTDAYCVRYYYNSTTNSSYLARSDNSTRLLIVYKESYSPFIFRDVNLFLNGDITLGAPLTFTGNCTINGRNSKITFTADGSLNVAPDSNLEVSLATLNFKQPSAFSLQGGTSNLKFRNSTINLDSDITLGDGKFEVYDDLTVTGPHQFLYASSYTTTIHSNSTLTFRNGAEFEIGKTRATTVEPIDFENNSAQLTFDNSTLHITGSGLILKKGIINIFNKSIFDIDWTDTTESKVSQGIILGDGVNSNNDPQLRIQGNGSSLAVKNGGATLDPATTTSIVQWLGQSQLILDDDCFVYVKRPTVVTQGWFMSDTTAILYINPTANVTSDDTRFTSLLHTQDYYMTGTINGILSLTLDRDDRLLLNTGSLNREITIKRDGNIISGVGKFNGNLVFTDYNSTLTWDIAASIDGIDVDLKGGRIIFTQDSGVTHTYSFKNTGTIDLTNSVFSFGAQEVDWSSNIYWMGSDATIKLNSDTNLTGIWTFSGSVLIDGQGYELDLEDTGTIIVERGSELKFKDAKVENVSRRNGIVCSDDSSRLRFADSVISLGGDYLFDKGSIEFVNKTLITTGGTHDTLYTFSYRSAQSSSIYETTVLKIADGIKFSIGRNDSTKINPVNQPLIFNDAASMIVLDGGILHITSSGMIMTKGMISAWDKSSLEMESSKYGLFLGDGTAENDFALDIAAGSIFTIKSGRIFYNNASPNRINFDSPESTIFITPHNGLYAKTNLNLSSGSIGTALISDVPVDNDLGKFVTYNSMHRFDQAHLMDFYVTGTPLATPEINLDSNNGILIYASTLSRDINIVKDNNKISGVGNLAGALVFSDQNSTLTWDLASSLGGGDVSLNGGRIRITQDSSLTDNFVFNTTGTVDLTTKKIRLSPEESTWSGNVYWIGDGATITLQNNVYLDGIWTLSGNVIIDGSEYLIDLGTTGSIILERGATLNLKNISVLSLDRQQRFNCKDDNCQIIMNNSELVLSGDFLFDKGSIFIYYDSDIDVISPEGTRDFIYTFSYTSNKPLIIDSLCSFQVFEGVRYSTGRNNSLITASELQPLNFVDPLTSKFILSGGTLHVTSSGMILTNGIIQVSDSSAIEIENTVYPYGLIMGNGVAADDFKLELNAGVKLTLMSGKIFYNNFGSNGILFDSPESVIAFESQKGIYAKRNLIFDGGAISSPLSTDVITDKDSSAYIIYNNMHRYDFGHLQDFYLTGTVVAEPDPTTILDSNDQLLVNPGTFNRNILINQYGNKVSGVGNISGNIDFIDRRSTLTWDINQKYSSGDVDLKGGRIIYTQDSGIGPQYSFKGSGTIDLTTKTLQLGTELTTWNGNFYWIGDGGIIRMNNDITLDGTWTLSGNITIDGNGYSMDLGTTGTIVLERGAQVTFNNFALYNMTRQNGITCRDNNCQITLNFVDLILAGDYLFDTGSIYVYYDSIIMPISPDLDSVFTFSYATTQPCLLDSDASLAIWPGIRLSTGRLDSTVTDLDLQPIIFGDPQTSRLILNGGTLHVTSSGMIMTKGTIDVVNSSNLEIESTVYPYGLILGDGTALDDFELNISGGYELAFLSGSLFYNNSSPNRIVFGSPASSIDIRSSNGFYAKRDLILKDGSLYTSGSATVAISKDDGIDVIQDNILRYYADLPYYSLQKRKVHGVRPYILENSDYYYITEGYTTNDVIARSGLSSFGGSAGFGGSLTLNNSSVSLQSSLSSPLFCSPTLNGGTFIVASNGCFGADKTFTGSGTVQFMGTRLDFGPKDLSLTHTIYWRGLTSGGINLNSKTNLSGSWKFGGTVELNGNNNILDLSNGGVVTIRPNSTLSLENVVIKGLGSGYGSINFMDDTATLKMSNVYLELDNNLSTTIGGIIVNGSSVVGLKNYNWTLDQNASMTIDGVSLWQDPLDKINYGKVKFGVGSIGKYLSLVSSGTIKTMSNLDLLQSDTSILQTEVRNSSNAITYLSDHFISIGDAKFYTINGITGASTINGHGKASGTINLSGSTLSISKDLNLGAQTTINSSGNFDLQGNALILDEGLTIPASKYLKIISSGIIDGCENNLEFAPGSKIIVDNNVTLTLRNINILSPASTNPIEMRTATSKLALQNAVLCFDRDYSFTQGLLYIHSDVLVTGSSKFSYASTGTSVISSHSNLYFDSNTTFSYSPRLTGRHALSERNLIKMIDKTSGIIFDQCKIYAPDSGWKLTTGSVYFDNRVTLTAGSSTATSFELGDGTAAGDVSVNVLADAFLENYGCLYYNLTN